MFQFALDVSFMFLDVSFAWMFRLCFNLLCMFHLYVSFMFLDGSFVLGCFVCVSIYFWMFHLCPCVSISVGKLGFHYVCWWLGEKIKFSSSNAPLQN